MIFIAGFIMKCPDLQKVWLGAMKTMLRESREMWMMLTCLWNNLLHLWVVASSLASLPFWRVLSCQVWTIPGDGNSIYAAHSLVYLEELLFIIEQKLQCNIWMWYFCLTACHLATFKNLAAVSMVCWYNGKVYSRKKWLHFKMYW